MSDDRTDLELWASIRSGNELAFRQLFDRYSLDLLRYGHHFTQDHGLVKDCLQEVFVALWQKAAKDEPLHNLAAYLFVCMRRLVLRRTGQAQRTLSHPALPLTAEEPSAEDHFIENERVAELNARLTLELRRLPDRQREALYLRYFQDLDYTQIATIMEVNKQVAYNYVTRGLRSLREQLNGVREVFFALLLCLVFC